MTKKQKIRVILDAEENVFRDIEISKDSHLVDLHNAIQRAFSFTTDELASFYYTNEEWMQGEEIPMEDMFDEGVITMYDMPLQTVFMKPGNKLIYVYDFLSLWTFFVELIEEVESKTLETETVFKLGELPEEAPQKTMISDEPYDLNVNFDIDDLDLN